MEGTISCHKIELEYMTLLIYFFIPDWIVQHCVEKLSQMVGGTEMESKVYNIFSQSIYIYNSTLRLFDVRLLISVCCLA